MRKAKGFLVLTVMAFLMTPQFGFCQVMDEIDRINKIYNELPKLYHEFMKLQNYFLEMKKATVSQTNGGYYEYKSQATICTTLCHL